MGFSPSGVPGSPGASPLALPGPVQPRVTSTLASNRTFTATTVSGLGGPELADCQSPATSQLSLPDDAPMHGSTLFPFLAAPLHVTTPKSQQMAR